MKFTALPLNGAYRIELEPKGDERGFFSRYYCSREFGHHHLATDWPQCNTSFSLGAGTIRGLHFQRPPKAEVKLVRCLRGAVWDVIVDLRRGSSTFGSWHGERIDETNRTMIYVPQGFAHGFQTLTEETEMLYFHSAPYSAPDEGGLRWDDPEVAVRWPVPATVISARDTALPLLKQLEPIGL